jgi:lysozyme family protein
MAEFDLFLPLLLKFEGGYCDDPDDPGGETNKGITMGTFCRCSHPLLGLEPTSENLKCLSDMQAGIIYREHYWNKIQGDEIALQELANLVCDFFVNAGTHATVLLQRILNRKGAHLIEDGIIGPATLQALSEASQIEVYRQYKQERIAYYRKLGQKYPKFLRGWLKRVHSFPDL